jgi:predicted aldo/keto reductase-like oxidoreductase
VGAIADIFKDFKKSVLTDKKAKASDCIKCGACEAICPQKLNIRELLEAVAKEFETEE